MNEKEINYRQFSCPMQTLNLINPFTNVLQKLVEAFFLNDLLRRLKDQHRIRSYVVMDLMMSIKINTSGRERPYIYRYHVDAVKFCQLIFNHLCFSVCKHPNLP